MTLNGWRNLKPRVSFSPHEAFVPVKVTLPAGTVTQYKRIPELYVLHARVP